MNTVTLTIVYSNMLKKKEKDIILSKLDEHLISILKSNYGININTFTAKIGKKLDNQLVKITFNTILSSSDPHRLENFLEGVVYSTHYDEIFPEFNTSTKKDYYIDYQQLEREV